MRVLRESIGSGQVVYLITCKASGEQYVGQSNALFHRLRRHCGELRRRTHHSRMMQRAFNTYGADAFEVEVLENCDGRSDQYRLTREAFYIRTLRPVFNGLPSEL
jgi:group I intron endonuclease